MDLSHTLDAMDGESGSEEPSFRIVGGSFRRYRFFSGPDGKREWLVLAFRGREALSALYRFDVDLSVNGLDDLDVEAALLGKPARFALAHGNTQRTIHGVVAAVRFVGMERENTRRVYRARLVPALYLRKLRRNSRVFQHQTVVETVSAVLRENGLRHRWELARKYPVREYCTQYEETDFRFINRLLGSAGIFYYFEQPAAGADGAHSAETLVFCDSPAHYPAARGTPARVGAVAAALAALAAESGLGTLTAGAVPVLLYRDAGGMLAEEEHIAAFGVTQRVCSRATTVRMRDPLHGALDLNSGAHVRDDARLDDEDGRVSDAVVAPARVRESLLPPPPAEVTAPVIDLMSDAAAGAASVLSHERAHEVYEHHFEYLTPAWSDAQRQGPDALHARQRGAWVAEGAGDAALLAPGHRFAMDEHPVSALNQEYVVVRVEHEGRAAIATHSAEGTSGEWKDAVYKNRFTCLPARARFVPERPARRHVQALESATVVGPRGEEAHPAAFGQIKVQFHWDREGRSDDHSSCWIRVVQPWAGAEWGVQFVPRVGMEVAVTFEGGDPNKPVVIGALYNEAHPTPYPLPEHKTRSGIKTQSSPGGNGYNELMFEDAAGREEVRVRAQRDLTVDVLNDAHTAVSRDDTRRAGRALRESVGRDHELDVGGHQTDRVAGNRLVATGANHTLRARGALLARADGDVSVTTDEQYNLTVRGNSNVVVGRPGAHPSTAHTNVYGDQILAATGVLTLSADAGLVLRCGGTTLKLGPEGVEINGTKLALAAKDVSVRGDGPSLKLGNEVQVLADVVKVFSEKASLVMDRNFAARGEKVRLGNGDDPPATRDEQGHPKTKPLHLRLTDAAFVPYANKHYHLLAGGVTLQGETDGDGALTKDIDADVKAVSVVLWTESYPTGPTRHYDVALGEVPAATTVEGAKTRLQNLGYYRGGLDGRRTEAFTESVREFQREFRLDPTGELDEPTSGRLTEQHGH